MNELIPHPEGRLTREEVERYTKLVQAFAARRRRQRERRLKLREARAKHLAPPPHTPYRFLLPNTVAHSILSHLSEVGPATRQRLAEDLRYSETSINGQILRLLDYGLVSRDRSAIYDITDAGEEALAQLNEGMSHTHWLT